MILEPKKIKSVTVSTLSPSVCHEVMGLDAMILVFWMLSFKPAFSLSSFTLIKRLFSSLLSAFGVVSSAYLTPGMSPFIGSSPCNLDSSLCHPARYFSWCTLHVSYISRVTIYSLDVLLSQFWPSPFIVACLFLTVASWPAYRFLRRQVRWSGISISLRILQFVVIHTVKGFHVVSEAKVDVLLELPCFFYDLVDVGNLISGSSAFSKSSLYI